MFTSMFCYEYREAAPRNAEGTLIDDNNKTSSITNGENDENCILSSLIKYSIFSSLYEHKLLLITY